MKIPCYREQVAAVVVTYNSESFVESCITSILNNGLPAENIVVVDNCSADSTVDVLKSGFPAVKVIHLTRNIGFGAGVNQGMSTLPHSSYALVLNPDVQLEKGALAALMKFAETTPCCGLVGPKLVGSSGGTKLSHFVFPSLIGEFARVSGLSRVGSLRLRNALIRALSSLGLSEAHSYSSISDESGSARRVDWLSGACMLVNLKVLPNSSIFDERYFHYYEDMDLCRRLSEAGWGVYWLPEAIATHHGFGSTKGGRTSLLDAYEWSSALAYHAKFSNQSAATAMRLVVLLRYCVVILVQRLGRLLRKDRQASERERIAVKVLRATASGQWSRGGHVWRELG